MVALRSKIWATLVMPAPCSIEPSTLGTQEIAIVDVAGGEHVLRDDVGTALLDGDVEALVLVEPLLDGGVVAGELRLCHPLQLQGDRGEVVVGPPACVTARWVLIAAAAGDGQRQGQGDDADLEPGRCPGTWCHSHVFSSGWVVMGGVLGAEWSVLGGRW